MKNFTLKRAVAMCCITLVGISTSFAQLSFTNSNSRLETVTHSGCVVTVTDVNFDGLDDLVRMDDGHLVNVDIQERDGNFTNYYITDNGGGSSWGMAVADIDQNGYKDIVADGNGGINVIKLFWNGTTFTYTTTTLANSGFFLQNITICDVNNDGWVDVFCCDDNDASTLYLNNGSGSLAPSNIINFALNPGIDYNGDPADSGNYGSVWTDFDGDNDLDLFVAHCRQSSSSVNDLRRKDRLFVNDSNNNYTEQSTAYGIELPGAYHQTWTATFGDIDNDGDFDLSFINHDIASQIFENDGTGFYTDITTGAGFSTPDMSIESVMEDFDNDGYIDILIAGTEWKFFKNDGDNTFTEQSNLFAYDGMSSFAIGDLNHDGFIDVFASYGDIYVSPTNVDDVLYLNDKNQNHFITFDLEGTTSNHGAIGAKVYVYGDFGVQVREVRAGESYGTINSSQLHFGLGQNTTIDSANVWFPSGETLHFDELDADQFVTVLEGSCAISGNIIPGPHIICTGQSSTLTAVGGYTSYLWNTGETTQSVTANSSGSYYVEVSDGTCNNISPLIDVEVSPDETPSVSAAGELVFCEGGSVTLDGISSSATAYLWSPGGATTQSFDATTSGNYTLTIQGVCGSFTSSAITVNVLPADAPTANDVTLSFPASTTLTATGTNPQWYDQSTGGTLLGTGNSYTTPVLNSETTYYVEDITVYPGGTQYTGITNHSGNTFSGNTTNGNLIFDVLENCTLNSVKVYTDVAGTREIQLKNSGGTVIANLSVNIPVGESRVNLNFALTPGFSYELTTNATVNNTSFGYDAPRLQRNSSGVAYPYTVTDVISITGSNQGSQYYYYFYDWEVELASTECVSERVPVVVDIATGINDNSVSQISLYPNPAKDKVFVSLNNQAYAKVFVNVMDLEGRTVAQQAFNNTTASQNLEVGLNSLAKGVYMVKVVADGTENVYKVAVK
jgi:hypothetical protein